MSGADRPVTVSSAALDDAAQILRDKYDVLLDRITDRLLDMPAPGTAPWYAIFRDQLSADIYRQRRSLIREALAHRAQVTTAAGTRSIRRQRKTRRRDRDDAQLSIW
ncbi:hypothetical protein [Antrihabitans stalactiti]|uniref:Uncharacterized protein n=1 Tax=Antrihabitans stalactiti TaxID=2584121 RepID=A0A848KJ19_9NOCA|nr:hypothetical protein [Antrihabitans stalactiti]NMN99073.1 hypothetical protein [Antrihabitans stalactiti]